ncbi:Urease accessory protein UreD [Rubrivivax sp. A210]|uniref:urease accessory protein UreD n=1 Tax=Rubrivivax sp. A210 TaxID=2772301 RepID=UPI00191B424E|nr:urease accessory protein UreD [Rubrivivax sp. A210]CAD5374376.1 Urease accessory protein UreD [Rubrivivax sp. A210]
MSWQGELQLRYWRDGAATRAHDLHHGPLRVLQALYPEGAGICHHVLVHPPGGIAGGDELRIDARVEAGAHALITTAGATRYYRSDGEPASQRARLRVAAGARLEWLPLETLAYPGCRADNETVAELAPGAEMMGWELLALGLPASGRPFASGWFRQHLELPGVWLDRGLVAADDGALLDSKLGWAGRRVLATLWFAAGEALVSARREALLEAAREAMAGQSPAAHGAAALVAGVTAVQPQVLVLRVLAPGVEPALALLMRVRAAWRGLAWGLAEEAPRVWRL